MQWPLLVRGCDLTRALTKCKLRREHLVVRYVGDECSNARIGLGDDGRDGVGEFSDGRPAEVLRRLDERADARFGLATGRVVGLDDLDDGARRVD